MKKATNSLHFPLNTLNQRLSAHYTEISSIYTAEMMKRVLLYIYSNLSIINNMPK